MPGPHIARIDQTAPALWSFTFRAPALTLVIAAVPGTRPGFAFLQRRPEGEHLSADGRVRALRELLEGGEVIALTASDVALELHVQCHDAVRVIRADDGGLRIVDASSDPPLPSLVIPSQGAPLEPEPPILATHCSHLTEQERLEARQVLKSVQRRLRNRIEAIERDEERARQYEQQALRVRSLVAVAARLPRGATALEGIDYSSGEAVPITLALDPARSAREQLEEVFSRARRMKRGEAVRRARVQEARSATEAVQAALAAIEQATDPQQVRSASSHALGALPPGSRPRVQRSPRAAERPSARETPGAPLDCAREYTAMDGTRILVGRDARSNDMLTTRVARPHDVWMHARGFTGSHVVIPMARGKVPNAEALVDAATLAAHFSDARGNDFVEVSWCERKFVRKPKGAPPGLVTLAREKTLRLRFEPERLQRLLGTVR
ncbi:MAG: DUF814 domain-containing protein [Deltaproteobacteria bacterium]|nr:DUF814 domain-containing protein [Deltaproteobacteria bacterium]